ncbi:hypothetical protein RHSIM_Rhsim05G0142200 [Rhododendron simsii]|uniref:EF hand associated type-2 domain-containing protein n=1 Tax=Rhododendron simsii TaxID=118357 RepID=A0A834H2G8_RHOSS|nr:hypothetical protein RHSIM_Rhsim05G0142200 [Rhododendron simsii]
MAGGGADAGSGVRIVVAGGRGTGKSSLIATAAARTFPINVPSLLPPTRLPDDLYPDRVPVTIIDTSSWSLSLSLSLSLSIIEHGGKLAEELKRADAVQVKVPVIVVGCKLDLRDDKHPLNLEQVMSAIMQQFREIETCIDCSAFKQIQVPGVFYYAQKAVLHPIAPLFDQEAQTLKPQFARALKQIFILCDHDRDGALSDAELNDFQVKCFNAPLQPSEIVGVMRVVQEKLPEGVNDRGLTFKGFLFLNALFLEKDLLKTTWTVLRKFGYNNDIRLSDDHLPPPVKRAPDQSAELASEDINGWTWVELS